MLTPKMAFSKIDAKGMLLVFPIDNARDPASLWYEFFPRSKMRWEWDAGGDRRVPDLWYLREKLSRSRKVIYAKWYKGRATFLSKELFVAMLSALNFCRPPLPRLSRTARELLEILEDNSPLSTKALKKAADLRGRENEARYTRALKELWERLLIVGFGEVDDGAFPSLAVGASRSMFEDLWARASEMDPEQAHERVRSTLTEKSLFFKFYSRCRGGAGQAGMHMSQEKL